MDKKDKSDNRPILFIVQEDLSLKPANKFWWNRVGQRYAIGEYVYLLEHDEVSAPSRAFFFVNLKKIYETLPEHLSKEFPTINRFRKIGLIKAGYCDHESLICKSEKQAEQVASFIGRGDEDALITIDGRVVHKFTAHSMKANMMQAKTFREAADKVLNWAAGLVKADVDDIPETNA